jgi:hypothetical protein
MPQKISLLTVDLKIVSTILLNCKKELKKIVFVFDISDNFLAFLTTFL